MKRKIFLTFPCLAFAAAAAGVLLFPVFSLCNEALTESCRRVRHEEDTHRPRITFFFCCFSLLYIFGFGTSSQQRRQHSISMAAALHAYISSYILVESQQSLFILCARCRERFARFLPHTPSSLLTFFSPSRHFSHSYHSHPHTLSHSRSFSPTLTTRMNSQPSDLIPATFYTTSNFHSPAAVVVRLTSTLVSTLILLPSIFPPPPHSTLPRLLACCFFCALCCFFAGFSLLLLLFSLLFFCFARVVCWLPRSFVRFGSALSTAGSG